MEITSFIIKHREYALSFGDYHSYQLQLSRKLRSLRKRLNQATPKGRPYTPKPAITVEHLNDDASYIYLPILCAERAWAFAMQMKAIRSTGSSSKGVVGSARRHVVSRFHRAVLHAQEVTSVLSAKKDCPLDLLEARAYEASLSGAYYSEKHKWALSLESYAAAKLIYAVLASHQPQMTIVRDFVEATVVPGLRLAAHGRFVPTTTPLDVVAVQNVPAEVRAEIEAVYPDSLTQNPASTSELAFLRGLPQEFTWQAHTVKLEDATISQALGAAYKAETDLRTWAASEAGKAALLEERVEQYDRVIIESQNAVDATKSVIDELTAADVDQSDKRMQALQVTRTGLTYGFASWRIGRNRVACGKEDGFDFDTADVERRDGKSQSLRPQKKSSASSSRHAAKPLESLRKRVALYDGIIQDIDLIRELPGISASPDITDLEAKRCYFQALRSVAIARSHALLSNPLNALALLQRASELIVRARLNDQSSDIEMDSDIPRFELSQPHITKLQREIGAMVRQYQALCAMDKLVSEAGKTRPNNFSEPMVEHLHLYPSSSPSSRTNASESHIGVDLSNLVTYPLKCEPIPVKPIFLDLAYNHIEYPTKAGAQQKGPPPTTTAGGAGSEASNGKKSWFGFGRS